MKKGIPNNNQLSIRQLAATFYQNNQRRNHLMSGAISLTIVILFCIGTVMKGRIDAEYQMEVRHNGSDAATSITFPTEEQVTKIKELSYIKEVGKMKYFADILQGDVYSSAGVYVSAATFNDFYRPAYTGIRGSLPQNKQEVMMARRGLEELGISQPVVGMTLTLDLVDDDKKQSQDFTLSGYFTEYVATFIAPPLAFFSQESVRDFGGDDRKASTLLVQQKSWYTGTDVEEKLYADVDTVTDEQIFEGGNTVNYNVIMRTVGGYDIAFLSAFLILLCVFFLNYNVMNLSIHKEIRQFGFLKTIGATNRQIRQVIYWQMGKILFKGAIFGVGMSLLIVWWLLPTLLSSYYLNNYGVSSQILTIEPFLLFFSLFVAGLLSLLSVIYPAYKTGKIVPIQSIVYQSQKPLHLKLTNKRQTSLNQMALRNLWRNKGSNLLTGISLFVGLMVALSSLIVVRGLDYSNNFDFFADFQLSGYLNPMVQNEEELDSGITQQEVDYLTNLEGLTSSQVLYGNVVKLNPEEAVWESLFEGDFIFRNYKTGALDPKRIAEAKADFNGTLMILEDDYLHELAAFVKEKNLPVDIDAVIRGEGAYSTDGTSFSKKILEGSSQVIGQSFEVRGRGKEGKETALKFAGYIDESAADFPPLPLHYSFKLQGPNLYVSQSAFDKVTLAREPLVLELNTTPEKEPALRKQFERFLALKESQIKPSERDEKMPFASINSAGREAVMDEIKTMKIVMYTISLLLIILGLFNYFNSTIVALSARQSELTIMESVGMTRKQLRKMLFLEGLYFSGSLVLSLTTLGSGILVLVYKILQGRSGYAKFVFPSIEMGLICIILIVFCLGLPRYLYHRTEKLSIVQRLRKMDEN